MLVIRLSFPSGKYHATPWDHHVNEGLVEWPPSPWRLCRALISLWKRHGSLDQEDDFKKLIESLSHPPQYSVPVFSTAHTRHYMPDYREGKDKIFDTFHIIERTAVLEMVWTVADLSTDEMNMLNFLLSKMNYLGRSESWVKAEALSENPTGAVNVKPLHEWQTSENTDPLWIMVPVSHDEYSEWYDVTVKSKSVKKATLPKDVFSAMDCGTDWLKDQRWSRNPGSRMVPYGAVWKNPAPVTNPVKYYSPDTVIYQLRSSVGPRIEQTLSIGERMRISLMSRSKSDNGEVPEVYSGKDPDGYPLTNDHQHAYFLPADIDRDGILDHLIVWAPWLLTHRETTAAGNVSSLWGLGGHTIYTGIQFLGEQKMLSHHPVIGFHRIWNSATPYYRTRHPKFYRRKNPDGRPAAKLNDNGFQVDGIEDLIQSELSQRGYPVPEIRIQSETIDLIGRSVSSGRFVSRRQTGKKRPEYPGISLQLVFPFPVWGPVSLGYGAHFGLGLFFGGITP